MYVVSTYVFVKLAHCISRIIKYILRKGLDTVESLSVEGKGSKTLGKIFLVL